MYIYYTNRYSTSGELGGERFFSTCKEKLVPDVLLFVIVLTTFNRTILNLLPLEVRKSTNYVMNHLGKCIPETESMG